MLLPPPPSPLPIPQEENEDEFSTPSPPRSPERNEDDDVSSSPSSLSPEPDPLDESGFALVSLYDYCRDFSRYEEQLRKALEGQSATYLRERGRSREAKRFDIHDLTRVAFVEKHGLLRAYMDAVAEVRARDPWMGLFKFPHYPFAATNWSGYSDNLNLFNLLTWGGLGINPILEQLTSPIDRTVAGFLHVERPEATAWSKLNYLRRVVVCADVVRAFLVWNGAPRFIAELLFVEVFRHSLMDVTEIFVARWRGFILGVVVSEFLYVNYSAPVGFFVVRILALCYFFLNRFEFRYRKMSDRTYCLVHWHPWDNPTSEENVRLLFWHQFFLPVLILTGHFPFFFEYHRHNWEVMRSVFV